MIFTILYREDASVEFITGKILNYPHIQLPTARSFRYQFKAQEHVTEEAIFFVVLVW